MGRFAGKRLAKAFTLVELMVSLAIFTGILALLTEYFSTAQRLWLSSAGKSELFENARIAMDLIENDLLCSFYSYGHSNKELYFFPSNSKQFGMAVTRANGPFQWCSAELYEVQYKHYLNGKRCQLLVNVVGDRDHNNSVNAYYDLAFPSQVTSSSNPFTTLNDSIYDAQEPDTNALDGWTEVIPYVVDFSFSIYDKRGRQIPSSSSADYLNAQALSLANPTTVGAGLMPYTVVFTLTLIDRDAYTRYFSMYPEANLSLSDDYNAFVNDQLIIDAKRSFTRQVTIEHGQYN